MLSVVCLIGFFWIGAFIEMLITKKKKCLSRRVSFLKIILTSVKWIVQIEIIYRVFSYHLSCTFLIVYCYWLIHAFIVQPIIMDSVCNLGNFLEVHNITSYRLESVVSRVQKWAQLGCSDKLLFSLTRKSRFWNSRNYPQCAVHIASCI
jgi:hypothetical protein